MDNQSPDTGARFRALADFLFDGNKSVLARALDMQPGSFSKYVQGNRMPGSQILKRLTRLGVNVNWFLTGDGPMMRTGDALSGPPAEDVKKTAPLSEDQGPRPQLHPVPLVKARVPENGPPQFEEVGTPEWLSEWFVRQKYDVDPERLRGFRGPFERMPGSIRAVDHVRGALVPPTVSLEALSGGGFYLVCGSEHVFATRILKENGVARLVGDDSDADDRTVSPEEWGEEIRPVARALDVVHPL